METTHCIDCNYETWAENMVLIDGEYYCQECALYILAEYELMGVCCG
jgi:hypothetical protein